MGLGSSKLRTTSFDGDKENAVSPTFQKGSGGKGQRRRSRGGKKGKGRRRRSSLGELEALSPLPLSPNSGSPMDDSGMMTFEEMDRQKLVAAAVDEMANLKSPLVMPPPAPVVRKVEFPAQSLLMSPSYVTTAPVFATPIKRESPSPSKPPTPPAVAAATSIMTPPAPSLSPNPAPTGMTPENFQEFLGDVKNGIIMDSREFFDSFRNMFGVGAPEAPVEPGTPATRPSAKEVEETAEKIKKMTVPAEGGTNKVSDALRHRMPGLWSEGMAKHAGGASASAWGLAPSATVEKGLVASRQVQFKDQPSASPVRLDEEEVLKSTENIVKNRAAAFGTNVQKKKKAGGLGVVTKLPCTPAKDQGVVVVSLSIKLGKIGDVVDMLKIDEIFETNTKGVDTGVEVYWVSCDGPVTANSDATALVLSAIRILIITETAGATREGTISWEMPRKDIESIKIQHANNRLEMEFVQGNKRTFEFKDNDDATAFFTSFYKTKPTPKKTTRTAEIETEDPEFDRLTDQEKDQVRKYRLMMKNKVPEQAVEHKMTMEGVSSDLVKKLVFNPQAMSVTSAASAPAPVMDTTSAPISAPVSETVTEKLSEEDEASLSKYKKMLKMHVPGSAVIHKMKMEGVQVRLIEAMFPEEKEENTPEEVKKPEAPTPLTEDEEKIANQYRKMLKMNVPPPAVAHKMKKEGVAENIVKALFGSPEKSAKKDAGKGSEKTVSKTPAKRGRTVGSGVELINLHWTPLTQDAAQNSVWGKVTEGKKLFAGAVEDSDVGMLEDLFHKKAGGKLKSKAQGNDGGSAKKKRRRMAGLIDMTRANNIAISLKAFKEFSFDEIAEVLKTLDRSKITGDRITFLASIMPNDMEQKAVARFRGEPEELLPAEQFFMTLQKVPRMSAKIKVLETMDTMTERSTDLSDRFSLVETVCGNVMSSGKLQKVLASILSIGNIMNEGTQKGDAAGFTLDSLMKLTQTKSVDGKMTILDYLVLMFAKKEQLEELKVSQEVGDDLAKVSRWSVNDMVSEATAIKKGMALCESELKKMKDGDIGTAMGAGAAAPKSRPKPKKKFQVASATGEDPRAALAAALKRRSEEPKSEQ